MCFILTFLIRIYLYTPVIYFKSKLVLYYYYIKFENYDKSSHFRTNFAKLEFPKNWIFLGFYFPFFFLCFKITEVKIENQPPLLYEVPFVIDFKTIASGAILNFLRGFFLLYEKLYVF